MDTGKRRTGDETATDRTGYTMRYLILVGIAVLLSAALTAPGTADVSTAGTADVPATAAADISAARIAAGFVALTPDPFAPAAPRRTGRPAAGSRRHWSAPAATT